MGGNDAKVFKKFAVILLLIVGFIALFSNISWFMKYLYPLKYEEYIIKYSKEHDVDPYLVAAVIKTESNFSPKVVSSQGAIGLMQLMPTTAAWVAEKKDIKDFKVEQLEIPEVNINIGTWYLSSLMKEFDGDITLVLAAYNGGRGNVAQWLKSGELDKNREEEIPFPETRSFVSNVKKTYTWYKRLYKL